MDRIDHGLHEKSAVHRILSMMPDVLCASVAMGRTTRSNARRKSPKSWRNGRVRFALPPGCEQRPNLTRLVSSMCAPSAPGNGFCEKFCVQSRMYHHGTKWKGTLALAVLWPFVKFCVALLLVSRQCCVFFLQISESLAAGSRVSAAEGARLLGAPEPRAPGDGGGGAAGRAGAERPQVTGVGSGASAPGGGRSGPGPGGAERPQLPGVGGGGPGPGRGTRGPGPGPGREAPRDGRVGGGRREEEQVPGGALPGSCCAHQGSVGQLNILCSSMCACACVRGGKVATPVCVCVCWSAPRVT